jgi:hypothetical protein
MSGVFRNIDPPPPHRPANVPMVRGKDTLARGRGGGGLIVQKTPNTALYSISISTLCLHTHTRTAAYFAQGSVAFSEETGDRMAWTKIEQLINEK